MAEPPPILTSQRFTRQQYCAILSIARSVKLIPRYHRSQIWERHSSVGKSHLVFAIRCKDRVASLRGKWEKYFAPLATIHEEAILLMVTLAATNTAIPIQAPIRIAMLQLRFMLSTLISGLYKMQPSIFSTWILRVNFFPGTKLGNRFARGLI